MKGRIDARFYEVKVKLTDPETLKDLKDVWDCGYFPSLTRMYDAALEAGLDAMRERREGGTSVYEGDIAERDRESLYALIASDYSDMREDGRRMLALACSVANAVGLKLTREEAEELYEDGALSLDPSTRLMFPVTKRYRG